MPVAVHFKVKHVAVEMAHVLYATMMEDNEWYGMWKKKHPELRGRKLESRFVEDNWPRLTGQARATMAQMLESNQYPDEMKNDIYEALVMDATLEVGRPKLIPGTKLLQ